MQTGDIVRNKLGMEFKIISIEVGETYCVKTEEIKSCDLYTFTITGLYNTSSPNSDYNLILPKEEVSIPDETDTILIPEIETDTIFEPYEAECIRPIEYATDTIFEPVGETKSYVIEDYESSLKSTKVDVSILITKLISEDADVQEILSKLKMLKKLVEL